jgi:hypothetical protein
MSTIKKLKFLFDLGSLTSAIRNYAKCLESWLMGSLVDIPQKMVDLKVVK